VDAMEVRSPAKCFEELVVWQRAHQLTLQVYHFTTSFPKFELYRMTSQLRRAAFSVPANIVEGFKKKGLMDKIRFLNIAQGSLEEAHYFLILAKDLNYGDPKLLLSQVDEVGKLLESYSNSIRRRKDGIRY